MSIYRNIVIITSAAVKHLIQSRIFYGHTRMRIYSVMCVCVQRLIFGHLENTKFCEVSFRSCDKIIIDTVQIIFLDINCQIRLNVYIQKQSNNVNHATNR
jgi:hypothetical protein